MTVPNALVIVPTYNERENLPRLVDAVLQYPNVRLLIVDDQSPDGTGAIADELSGRHPDRVSVMHRTARRGIRARRTSSRSSSTAWSRRGCRQRRQCRR